MRQSQVGDPNLLKTMTDLVNGLSLLEGHVGDPVVPLRNLRKKHTPGAVGDAVSVVINVVQHEIKLEADKPIINDDSGQASEKDQHYAEVEAENENFVSDTGALTKGYINATSGTPPDQQTASTPPPNDFMNPHKEHYRGSEKDSVQRTSQPPPSIAARPTTGPAPPSNGSNLSGQPTAPADSALRGVANTTDAIAVGIDATAMYLDAQRVIGKGAGAPKFFGPASTFLAATSVMETSTGVADFTYTMSTGIAVGYVSSVVSSAVAGALATAPVHPVLAPIGGAVAGTATALGLSYSISIVESVVNYPTFMRNYIYLDREITNLYMRRMVWPPAGLH